MTPRSPASVLLATVSPTLVSFIPTAMSPRLTSTVLLIGALFASIASAQNPAPAAAPAAAPTPPPGFPSAEERQRLDKLAREDHADMLRQLGITKLRPGANGRAQAGEPGAANYDEAKANLFPDWPEVLTLKNGQKVTTPETWWKQRRPEIAEDFEREVIGRIPNNVPKVTWEVAETVNTKVGDIPVVAKRVIGHVDNSAYPEISVDIKLAVVTPANAKSPVPVLMMFGFGNMPDESAPRFGPPRRCGLTL